MKIKMNYDNDDLWCVESKERIELGERYVEAVDSDGFVKTYKTKHAPVDNEGDDLYIGE